MYQISNFYQNTTTISLRRQGRKRKTSNGLQTEEIKHLLLCHLKTRALLSYIFATPDITKSLRQVDLYI